MVPCYLVIQCVLVCIYEIQKLGIAMNKFQAVQLGKFSIGTLFLFVILRRIMLLHKLLSSVEGNGSGTLCVLTSSIFAF